MRNGYHSRGGGSEVIKLGPDPQVFALKFTSGKDVQSMGPNGRLMFTTTDGARIFLDLDEGNDFEHDLRDMRIQPGQPIAVSRVQHGRGGGFSIRVRPAEREQSRSGPQRFDDTRYEPRREREQHPRHEANRRAPEYDDFDRAPSTEDLLERSVRIARHDPGAFRQNRHIQALPVPASPLPAEPAHAKGKMGNLLAGALIASIDAYIAAADYAKSRDIPVSIKLDFNGEDIRSSASVMQIEYYRSGGSRA